MNTEDIIARVSTSVDASKEKVWEALVTPKIIKEYFFGTEVKSDFKVGSKIVWKGDWNGKPYEDHGEIREAQAGRLLQFTHISPSDEKELEENYRVVTIILDEKNGKTKVTLTQDNNPNDEAREKSEQNWQGMLDGLKKVVEAKK